MASSEMLESNLADQDNELMVLSEIMDNFEYTRSENCVQGKMHCNVSLVDPIKISVEDKSNSDQSIVVQFLPPIIVKFTLNKLYPSQNPPEITLECPWLNADQLSHLTLALNALWNQCEVLFEYVQCVENETLQLLELDKEIVIDVDELTKGCIKHQSSSTNEEMLINKETSVPIPCEVVEESIERDCFSSDHLDFIAEVVVRKRLMRDQCEKQVALASGQKDNRSLKGDFRGQIEKIFKDQEDQTTQLFVNNQELGQRHQEQVAGVRHIIEIMSQHGLTGIPGMQMEKKTCGNEQYWGTVKKWVKDGDFGFILCPLIFDQDIFFRSSSIHNPDNRFVRKGDLVLFSVDTSRRIQAVDVKFLPSQPCLSGNRKATEHLIEHDILDVIEDYKPALTKQEIQHEDQMVPNPSEESVNNESLHSESEQTAESCDNNKPISATSLMNLLKSHNEDALQLEFEKSEQDCIICFERKLGIECIQFLPCHHAFCKECIRQHFIARIEEGCVNNLCCPEPKCDSKALPKQVELLVPKVLYDRYEQSLLETTLNEMTDVVLCPRRACQCPSLIDNPESNLARCSKCSFVFCALCKATYHGVAPCNLRLKEMGRVVQSYMDGSASQRENLERRYGKKKLESLRDEMLSEEYKQKNSIACPRCKAPIQKSYGCNKMTCSKCNTHFCFLCGARLFADNPYHHFSIEGTECYNKLFEGMAVDQGDDDAWQLEDIVDDI